MSSGLVIGNMSFLDLLSASAITTTIGMFLCGVPICLGIHRKGTTEGSSSDPLGSSPLELYRQRVEFNFFFRWTLSKLSIVKAATCHGLYQVSPPRRS